MKSNLILAFLVIGDILEPILLPFLMALAALAIVVGGVAVLGILGVHKAIHMARGKAL